MCVPRARRHLSHGERSDRLGDPGEGLGHIDSPYPLSPTLSPWERERASVDAISKQRFDSAASPLPRQARPAIEPRQIAVVILRRLRAHDGVTEAGVFA